MSAQMLGWRHIDRFWAAMISRIRIRRHSMDQKWGTHPLSKALGIPLIRSRDFIEMSYCTMPRSEPIASVKWQVLRRTDWTDSYNFLIYLLLSLHLSLPRCHVAAAAASFRVLADNRGRSRHPVWPKCPVRRTLESDRICKSWQSKHSSDSGWWWITMDPIFCESNLIGAFLIASPGPKVEAWFDRISLDVDPLDEAPEREHTHRCRAQMESLAGISRNIKESSWEITWNQFDHFWTFENLGWSWFWSSCTQTPSLIASLTSSSKMTFVNLTTMRVTQAPLQVSGSSPCSWKSLKKKMIVWPPQLP